MPLIGTHRNTRHLSDIVRCFFFSSSLFVDKILKVTSNDKDKHVYSLQKETGDNIEHEDEEEEEENEGNNDTAHISIVFNDAYDIFSSTKNMHFALA
jgi:negative regulator of genetic competence, sporulation and motility